MLESDTEFNHKPGVGDVIDERYALFDRLEVESDANVFRARHIPSRDFVHLYLFDPVEISDDSSTPHVDEFKLQALKSFMHPNVVRVREVDRAFGTRRFIAYQEVDAPTLAQALSQHGALDDDEALGILHGVLDALAAGHSRGLVHGRLTPNAIVLSGEPGSYSPKVREFGVVTVLDLDNLPELSVDVAYMAPEQLRGAPPSVQSDLYSWGLILAEALTGRPVFVESEGNITARQLSDDPVPLPEDLDEGIANLLRRALLKDPSERYRSADELFYAVAQLQHGHFGADAAALVGTGSHPAFTEFGTQPNFDAPKAPAGDGSGELRAMRSLDGSIKSPGTGESPAVDSAPALAGAAPTEPPPPISAPGLPSAAMTGPAQAPAGTNPLVWIIPSALAALLVVGAVFYLITSNSGDAVENPPNDANNGTVSPAEQLPPAPVMLARVYEAFQLAPDILRSAVRNGLDATRKAGDNSVPRATSCANGASDDCLDWTWWAIQQPEADWEMAVARASERCNDDDAAGCATLGMAHKLGHGVELSHTQTLDFLEKACAADVPRGCAALGQVHEDGFGVKHSNPKAAEWYRKGCELGDQRSCVQFGRMLDGVKNVHADFERAITLFADGCNTGVGEGCQHLARMYEKGRGVPPDLETSHQFLAQACDLGVGESCRLLGYSIRNADDADDVAYTRAAELYVQGCEQDSGKSCDGACYFALAGEGMPKSADHAYQWCERACALNDPDGCYRFGVMLRDGVGTEPDYKRAAEMFRKACDGGNKDACTRLESE